MVPGLSTPAHKNISMVYSPALSNILGSIAYAFQRDGSMKKNDMDSIRIERTLFLRYLNWVESNNYIRSNQEGDYMLTERGKLM